MNRYRFFPARKGLLADLIGAFKMWRSLFYAVGIGLFALGLQALVVEHVTVPRDTKFQKLVRKVFEDDKPVVTNMQPVQAQMSTQAANQAASNWNRQIQAPRQTSAANQSYGVNTGSRFGPSRFSGPAYGTGYGGPRVTSNPAAPAPRLNAPPFGNPPQYQSQNRTNAQLAGYSSAPTANKPRPKLQKVMIREWMPWSLLASGAIIFLYTHTHHRRRYGD